MEHTHFCKNEHHQGGAHHAGSSRGPSSFHMQNPELVFSSLELKTGNYFLDLGCGAGDYSLRASEIIGETGMVYAFDALSRAILLFNETITAKGISNIIAKTADIRTPLEIDDQCIDTCMIATVLHSFENFKNNATLFNEIRRVLKSDGKLAIIECKKEGTTFGPPLNMRISPDELTGIMADFGFKKLVYTDLGFNYMLQFAL